MYGAHLAYQWIKPTDRVLDIGGAAQPFRRADCVLDVLPYEKRNIRNSFFQSIPEKFTENSWFIHDICDPSRPFPFKDKEFDFLVCGHVLEDVRDPLWVLSEIQRVAKRGYLETPSRFHEQLLGVDHPKLAGNAHHRWFVDYRTGKDKKKGLAFIFKNGFLQVEKKYQIKKPRFGSNRLNANYSVSGFYFDGPFNAWEDTNAAVSDSREFMQETLDLAQSLGKKLWDTEPGFPVKLRDFPKVNGIISLNDLVPFIDKRLNAYGKEGVSNKILEFESNLIAR